MLSKTKTRTDSKMRWLLRADGVLYYCKTRKGAQRFASEIKAQSFSIIRRRS